MEEKKEGILGAVAFNTTLDNELEYDEKTNIAKKIISPEEFGKKFLIEKIVHKNVRDKLGEPKHSISDMNRNKDDDKSISR